MSSEANHINAEGEQARLAQRKRAQFQEAPGEAQAAAVGDAFMANAAADPSRLTSALSDADGTTRADVIRRLQRQQGNAFVQRVAAEARGTPGRLVGRSQPEMVEEVLHRKGPGGQLPEGARQQMEGYFGAGMDGVRVHADAEAAALSRELNAEAFTVGRDVFFAEGRFDPSSTSGQAVLAHELTHVGQQTGFGGQTVQRQGAPEEEEEAVPQQSPSPAEEGAAAQQTTSPAEEGAPAQQTASPAAGKEEAVSQQSSPPVEEEQEAVQRQEPEPEEEEE